MVVDYIIYNVQTYDGYKGQIDHPGPQCRGPNFKGPCCKGMEKENGKPSALCGLGRRDEGLR